MSACVSMYGCARAHLHLSVEIPWYTMEIRAQLKGIASLQPSCVSGLELVSLGLMSSVFPRGTISLDPSNSLLGPSISESSKPTHSQVNLNLSPSSLHSAFLYNFFPLIASHTHLSPGLVNAIFFLFFSSYLSFPSSPWL